MTLLAYNLINKLVFFSQVHLILLFNFGTLSIRKSRYEKIITPNQNDKLIDGVGERGDQNLVVFPKNFDITFLGDSFQIYLLLKK